MATISTLVRLGKLVRVDPGLPPSDQELRLLYGSPKFITWLDQKLPSIPKTYGGDDDPLEQVVGRFEEYAAGQPMAYGKHFKRLHPNRDGVWEIKTADIRIFGWFHVKDLFIAVHGDDASYIKQHGLYHGYIKSTVRFRDQLDLDEPKYVQGGRIEDVVSD